MKMLSFLTPMRPSGALGRVPQWFTRLCDYFKRLNLALPMRRLGRSGQPTTALLGKQLQLTV